MKIYVVVQHSERSAYMARRIRRWIYRFFRMADFLLDAAICGAILAGIIIACMVDSMDELLALRLLLGCVSVCGLAVMLKAAIEPGLRKKPGRRINRTE